MVSGEPPLANSNSLVLPAMMFSAQKIIARKLFPMVSGEPPLANSNSLVLPAMMFSAQKIIARKLFPEEIN